MAGETITFNVTLTGQAELHRALASFLGDLESQRRAAMHRAVILVREDARGRIHSPEGRARRGIRSDVFGSGSGLRGRVQPSSAAAIFSQRSRGPGKRMPPVKKIERWLRRIGQMRSRSSAYLVARRIAKHGTQGHPVMRAALHAKQRELESVFSTAVERSLRDAIRRAR